MNSIVVPTYNRASVLSLVVQSLLAQNAPFPFEVIVVDNNSTDDTRERILGLQKQAPERLRYVFEKEQGLSAALNAGIAVSRGDVVAFIDDDAVADPDWLRALAETFRAHPDAWCVGGKIALLLPKKPPSWFSRRSEGLMSYLSGLDLGDATIERRYPDVVWGGNFAVRRDVLVRLGGFDTRLNPVGGRRIEAADTVLCWRIQLAGGHIYYCGEARVIHLVPETRMTKRFFRTRACWRGITWRLVDRKGLYSSNPKHLVRPAIRVAKNWITWLIFPHAVDRPQIFEVELRLWECLAYLYQALVMRGAAGVLSPFAEGHARVDPQRTPPKEVMTLPSIQRHTKSPDDIESARIQG